MALASDLNKVENVHTREQNLDTSLGKLSLASWMLKDIRRIGLDRSHLHALDWRVEASNTAGEVVSQQAVSKYVQRGWTWASDVVPSPATGRGRVFVYERRAQLPIVWVHRLHAAGMTTRAVAAALDEFPLAPKAAGFSTEDSTGFVTNARGFVARFALIGGARLEDELRDPVLRSIDDEVAAVYARARTLELHAAFRATVFGELMASLANHGRDKIVKLGGEVGLMADRLRAELSGSALAMVALQIMEAAEDPDLITPLRSLGAQIREAAATVEAQDASFAAVEELLDAYLLTVAPYPAFRDVVVMDETR